MESRGLLELGPVAVDLDAQSVQRSDGETVLLSALEVDLLEVLVAHRGETVARRRLVNEVLADHRHRMSRALDHAIVRLRQKIEVDPMKPRWLITVRTAGYRLEANARSDTPL
ncbi:MAG: winged helix-turn-helix domain-containing protein [Myxococcota bacterium]